MAFTYTAFRKLTPTFAVSPQLTVADVANAAAQGYRAIICNRPDAEDTAQPAAATIAAAAERHGLAFAHVPVVSGRFRDTDIALMRSTLATVDGPVLAYCRTGSRSASLYALCEQRETPKAGLQPAHDLSSLEERLDTRGHEGATQ